VLVGRLGVFQALARLLIRDRASRAVAMPAALQAAGLHRMPAGRLTVAVAITANAASFLLARRQYRLAANRATRPLVMRP
jgi:hypothetical protein